MTPEEERLQLRYAQADAFAAWIKGGKCTDPMLIRFAAILRQVDEAKLALSALYENQDAHQALPSNVDALRKTLDEAPCAVLRAYMFQVPEKQQRAYKEIEERLMVLVHTVEELQKGQQ